MLKSITGTMLTSAMSLAWTLIRTGERTAAFAESRELHEGNEQRAGFVELFVWRVGNAIVNRFAMWCGHDDGEVSGMVALAY